ncbi:coagulation factor IX-like [Panonychus citri]|uniref:coagulation factor IX-like n=1 Tax=Panonychus citri TaxID=50023 RepID=UPI0023074BDB|nr:coagulation factor IX-like [Panonychus citri]
MRLTWSPVFPSQLTVIIFTVIIFNCVKSTCQYCVTFDFDDPNYHENFASLQSTIIQLESNSTVNIITPGYNESQHYPSNLICSWTIKQKLSNYNHDPIAIHFDDFNLENSFNCVLDSLWLFIGKNLTQSPDYRFCGSIKPDDQIFNTTTINLIFITDSHRNYRGFNISFKFDNSKGSHESKCVDTLTQFSCSNGNCVNSSLVCNEIDDCHDGSDEDECHHNDIVDDDDDNDGTRMVICPSWINNNKLKGRLSIIGGTTSLPNSWPWQVSLRIRSQSSIHWKHICGAVLINYSTILTAAHCFHNKHLNLTKYSLAFGEYKLDDESSADQLITRYPRDIIIHPDYQLNGVNGKEDDIAVIKLNYPVYNLTNIKPVCIHNWTTFDDLPKYGFVTGWSQGLNNLINVLSEVRLPLISGSQCSHYYGNEFFIDSDKIICAGQKEGHKDSCKGDSGGPLVVNLRGGWSLIALVSSGSGCGLPEKPGIYTNVNYYSNWIMETIKKIR